jgi:hypothetical protein
MVFGQITDSRGVWPLPSFMIYYCKHVKTFHQDDTLPFLLSSFNILCYIPHCTIEPGSNPDPTGRLSDPQVLNE